MKNIKLFEQFNKVDEKFSTIPTSAVNDLVDFAAKYTDADLRKADTQAWTDIDDLIDYLASKVPADKKKEFRKDAFVVSMAVAESETSVNESQIPVFKDVAQKDKEMIDQKDLAGFIKGKLDAVEAETDPSKQRPVLVVVQDPKYWQREFVVMEVDNDYIKTQDRNKKPVTLKIKDVIGVFAQ